MTELIQKTFSTADLLAKEGLHQIAFRTYLTALTASSKQLLELELSTLPTLPSSECTTYLQLLDTSFKCLTRVRDLFSEASGFPIIPPKASHRPTSRPRPTTPDPDSSSVDSGPLLLLTPPLTTPPLTTPLRLSFHEKELGLPLSNASSRSRESSPPDFRKKIDTVFHNPFVKRPPGSGRRARARSLVNSLKARFETGVEETESVVEETTPAPGPGSVPLTLKTMFSSPALTSTTEKYHTDPAPSKLSTSSLSDEELSIEKALRSPPSRQCDTIPLEWDINPEDLVPARTLPPPDAPTPTTTIPRIPRSPLLTSLLQANKRLDAAKQELVLLTRQDPLRQNPHPIEAEPSPSLTRLQLTIAEASTTLEKISRLTRIDAIEHTFTFFPPNLIGYQLTLIEATLFHDIPSDALRVHTHRQPHPKIVASTNFFNFLTRIIETSILDVRDEEDRITTIIFWIQVGETLESLHNFQSLQAVVSGLNTPPLVRLKRTWSRLPKKYSLRLQAIQRLMSEENNYQSYRRHIDSLDCSIFSIIPYIGVFIMDMTYLSAISSKSLAATEDSRVTQLLSRFAAFLSSPHHSPVIPPRFLKGHGHNKSSSGTFSRNLSLSPLPTSSSPTAGFLPFVASLGDFGSTGEADSPVPRRKPLQDPDLVRQMQLVLTHFLLNRAWIPDAGVDHRSLTLEPRPSECPPEPEDTRRTTWFSSSRTLPQTFAYLKSSPSKRELCTDSPTSDSLPHFQFSPLELSTPLDSDPEPLDPSPPPSAPRSLPPYASSLSYLPPS